MALTSYPDLRGSGVGGVTTGSPGRLSAVGMGEGAAESLELTLWPSEPKSLANFTWGETECTGLPFHMQKTKEKVGYNLATIVLSVCMNEGKGAFTNRAIAL